MKKEKFSKEIEQALMRVRMFEYYMRSSSGLDSDGMKEYRKALQFLKENNVDPESNQ